MNIHEFTGLKFEGQEILNRCAPNKQKTRNRATTTMHHSIVTRNPCGRRSMSGCAPLELAPHMRITGRTHEIVTFLANRVWHSAVTRGSSTEETTDPQSLGRAMKGRERPPRFPDRPCERREMPPIGGSCHGDLALIGKVRQIDRPAEVVFAN
jgi:hypothetical protein